MPRIWLVPLLFAAIVGALGWTSYRAISASVRVQLASQLTALLDADVKALRVWLEGQRDEVRLQAEAPYVRSRVAALLELVDGATDPAAVLMASDARFELSERLAQVARMRRHIGWGVAARDGLVLASSHSPQVGRLSAVDPALRAAALEKSWVVSAPLQLGLAGAFGGAVEEREVLLAVAAVRDAAGEPTAVLSFGLAADAAFSEILRVARMGESGETYAFDADGLMVSSSRFDGQLRELGLLPDDPDIGSAMRIHVRDPGGNMPEGFEPSLPVLARPLTRMAADAIVQKDGVELEPYRDYRGVEVVGAWAWLSDLGIGVATEIDAAEAFTGLDMLRRRILVLVAALVLGALAIFFYTWVLTRLRARYDKVQRLGRYQLLRKIGEGGMGTVYLGRHALLRRPTAIKMLRRDAAGRGGLERFEREVQVTARLTHPNTIAIYDYGHTPEGVFYYAMEYLHGITAATCVEEDGPQAEARVVYIMKQVCASLAEAHAAGLIHRDLKPANLMLCERGGQLDFVKVLDFGLVRSEDQSRSLALTRADALTGTPLYLSPEAVESPETLDVRSDLYQLGAVVYYLVVGRPVFTGKTVIDVLDQHLNSPPEPPSEVLGRAISPDLEEIMLRCLEKDRAKRYANAEALLRAFEDCRFEGTWSQVEASAWWAGWNERHPAPATEEEGPGSMPSAFLLDIHERLGSSEPRD